MTLKTFVGVLCHRIWSTDEALLLVRPAGTRPDPAKRKQCRGEFRPVTEENISDCGQIEDANQYVPIYREMLKKGDYVHYGYMDGHCVFRNCLMCSGSFDFRNIAVHELGPDERYIHYGFCAPEFRGLGLHAESIYIFCTKNPDAVLYALVRENNTASLRSYERNGFLVKSRIKIINRLLFRRISEEAISKEESDKILAH